VSIRSPSEFAYIDLKNSLAAVIFELPLVQKISKESVKLVKDSIDKMFNTNAIITMRVAVKLL